MEMAKRGMIEVEKKFRLFDGINCKLQALGGQCMGTHVFRDVYWDTTCYQLTKKNIWLRQRDDKWELKIPVGGTKKGGTDRYEELTTEEDISVRLGHFNFPSLSELQSNGFPFASITTTRESFRINEFRIDVDSACFGYSVGEVELLVPEEKDVEDAVVRINDFIALHSLSDGRPVSGKVIEFLRTKERVHYDTLVEVGVIPPPHS